jgi:hypothetical protein
MNTSMSLVMAKQHAIQLAITSQGGNDEITKARGRNRACDSIKVKRQIITNYP